MAGRRAVILMGAIALAGCGGSDGGRPGLPITGKSPGGGQYRLEAGRPDAKDDGASRWCLRLRYTGGIVVDGNRFSEGTSTCEKAPARRVSGAALADCERGVLYVFGAARAKVGKIELAPRHGPATRAKRSGLPPRSGFAGSAFVLAFKLDRLPAVLREAGPKYRPYRTLFRFDKDRSRACRPLPGAPKGGGPSLTFPD